MIDLSEPHSMVPKVPSVGMGLRGLSTLEPSPSTFGLRCLRQGVSNYSSTLKSTRAAVPEGEAHEEALAHLLIPIRHVL